MTAVELPAISSETPGALAWPDELVAAKYPVVRLKISPFMKPALHFLLLPLKCLAFLIWSLTL
jgi:hypothetical protein